MDMSITTMTIDDYDEVLALWRAADGVSVGESDSRERVGRYLDRNPATCFVARTGGAVIGSLLCGNDGRCGYLNHMAIATSHRRRGVGTALVNHCADVLREMGIPKCNLFVYADNATGIAFWRKLGW